MSKAKKETTLDSVFESLSNEKFYRNCCKERIAKIVLPASEIRVFSKGTKQKIIEWLLRVQVDRVVSFKTQADFDKWHTKQVQNLYKHIVADKKNVKRLTKDGILFGHAPKILNLFLGHLVFFSHYFSSSEVKQIRHFLHIPFDKKVFDAFRACKISGIPESIKSITKTQYRDLQALIRETAGRKKLPPLYFDEYAWSVSK